MSRKRIALLLGQPEEDYQSSFIDGVMQQAFKSDFDVCIFSMFIKYQDSKEREIGDSNIYNLINYNMFDAFIILSDTIQTPGVEKEVEKRIHRNFNGPVVCIDTDSEYFYSFWTDGYSAVYATISHLIEEHDLKDIAYLTGLKSHVHSQRRLDAFRDCMKAHGLEVRENRVFYGDFWYTSGTGCAEALARDRESLPEAVVCANDCMAIGLIDEFTSRGIRVPEDVAVFGYGTGEEGQKSPLLLSSTFIPAEYYGRYSVDCVMKLFNGDQPDEASPEARLFIGETCGCRSDEGMRVSKKRDTWMTEDSEEGFYSIHNTCMEDILLADSLHEMFNTLYENIHYLRGVKSFDVCLNEEWLSEEKLVKNIFPKSGYSNKSINILSYSSVDPSICRVGDDKLFVTSELFPHSYDESIPSCYLFMPLFFEDNSFGYGIVSYGSETGRIEDVVRHWMKMISRGLEGYRRQHAISVLELKNSIKSEKKFPTYMYSDEQIRSRMEKLDEKEREELELVSRILDENKLTYHFQPIVSAVDGEIFSYEALMRSDTRIKIAPLEIIKMADLMDRLDDVERATLKNVLGIIEDDPDRFGDKKIFINSIPGCRVGEEDRRIIEELLGRHSDKVVIELTEQAEMGDEELYSMKADCDRLGLRIAVDDYGTGYSNVGNLLRYMPDYVKIDGSLVSEIQSNPQKQHFVREIIDFCHANNIKALAEGVETVEELSTVIRLGVDLLQGFYLCKPYPDPVSSIDSNKTLEISRFHREREDNAKENEYHAGRTRRVSVNTLIKQNKTTIIIGEKDATFRDITIVGTPNTETKLHIEILEGFDGRLTLEDINLSSIKNRPCIHMADNCDMTLSLVGENRFVGGGIKVPETSKLTIDGEGNLKVMLFGNDTFGIGNSSDKGHGCLEFYQDGEIYIESNGQNTIGIGSGLGGNTKICKGKYLLRLSGDSGVGLGSLDGDQSIVIHDCDLMMNTSFYNGVCIGSLKESTSISIWRSLIRCTCVGQKVAILGSVDGEMAEINLTDLNFKGSVRSDFSTAAGSLYGGTRLNIEKAGYNYRGVGKKALVYGGYGDDTQIELNNSDVSIDLVSDEGKIAENAEGSIKENYVFKKVKINGTVLE